MSSYEPSCLWDAGAELGEGPVWDTASGTLYFTDIKRNAIHRCSADGRQRQSWTAPGQAGFVLPLAGGAFVCGLPGALMRFDPSTGSFAALCEVEPGLPGNRLNDGYVDASGYLWFGTMDNGERAPTGSLYRLGSDGRAHLRDSGYAISNGPCMNPAGAVFYHTDTLERVVYAFDVGAGGALSNRRVFARISNGNPDGSTVDAAGNVWVAIFGGGRVERYRPDGQLDGVVNLPCPNITKIAFGGADLRTVFVTTARKGLSAAQLAAQPQAGALFAFRSPVPGQPQYVCTQGVSS